MLSIALLASIALGESVQASATPPVSLEERNLPASSEHQAVTATSAGQSPERPSVPLALDVQAPAVSTAGVEPAGATPATDGGSQASDIIVTARRRPRRGDPLLGANVQSFLITQRADEAVVMPLTRLYEHGLPSPLRTGLSNFLNNLHEPVVAANYVLQLKPGKAAETVGRMLINSTLGVAGVVDVAKRRPFGLPRRRNGFGNTLGFYGVGPGPFLFLPLVGPTTVRDLAGDVVDRSMLPISLKGPFRNPAYTVPAAVLGTLERRSQLEPTMRAVNASPDPYSARRDQYLERRRKEIGDLHGAGGHPPAGHPAQSRPNEPVPTAPAPPGPLARNSDAHAL